MVEVGNLSFGNVILFILFSIGLTVLYYKKIMTIRPGENKKIEMLKKMSYLFILAGIVNTFTTTNDIDFKTLLLVILVVFVNLYNIHVSLKKCPSYPNLYKIRLYVRTIIVIIILSLFLRYSDSRGLFSFLYGGPADSSVTTIDDISTKIDLKLRGNIPKYCPNMKNDNYTDEKTSEGKLWKSLSSPQKNNCLASDAAIREGGDISDKIYA